MSTSLRDELTAIYDRRRVLTPEVVVEEAKPKDAPLHDRFEWNDKVAGHQYRLVQAQALIRSVTVTYTDAARGEEVEVRKFVAVRRDRTYQPIEEVAADPFATKLLLAQLQRDLQALKSKYGHLEDFLSMVDAELKAS